MSSILQNTYIMEYIVTMNLSEHKAQSTLFPSKHARNQITGRVKNGQNKFLKTDF